MPECNCPVTVSLRSKTLLWQTPLKGFLSWVAYVHKDITQRTHASAHQLPMGEEPSALSMEIQLPTGMAPALTVLAVGPDSL